MGWPQSMRQLSIPKVGVTEMKTTFIAVTLAALVSSAYAAGALRPSQAMAYRGQLALIEGIADIQSNSSNSRINVKLTGSDNSHFTAFIPEGNKNRFPTLDTYNGKTVDVFGVVYFESGGPTIMLTQPNQIKLASP
jgi:opacity protein-like surface antigen